MAIPGSRRRDATLNRSHIASQMMTVEVTGATNSAVLAQNAVHSGWLRMLHVAAGLLSKPVSL